MRPHLARKLIAAAALAALAVATCAQQPRQDRAPAVPLITHDPYFSVWSLTDTLTASPTRHWTGTEQPMDSLLRIDGKPFRLMGDRDRDMPALPQTGLEITATHTRYTFEGAGVRCTLSFLSPLLPNDLTVLARPVTYLSWHIAATDGAHHDVQVYFAVDPRLAVNTPDQPVTWGRSAAGPLAVLNVGSQDQRVLNRSGDNLRADWGYFHLAVPSGEEASTSFSRRAPDAFAASGTLPAEDDTAMPQAPNRGAPFLAVDFPLSVDANGTADRHVLVSFTQTYVIAYLDRKLKAYWTKGGTTEGGMLAAAEAQFATIEMRSTKFDADLHADLERVGGPDYARVATLAYRQTLAANGLATDLDGSPLQFPKENFSNGCISTVDVLYPSSPFFVFFSPALLEAQLKPVMEYAATGRWKFPFAPHDLGQYPLADGQVYGGGEKTEDDQMPVEESGNMLVMIAAMGRAQGNLHFAEHYWPLLTKWVDFLRMHGLDPEKQLTTDDFAGHVAHNANLSLKAIVAIAAYAEMARGLGHTAESAKYAALAKGYAGQWQTMAREGDHYKLGYEDADSWSQKYNLVWDKLLGYNLFPASVRESELRFYETKLQPYGLPLDSRKMYTKLDWEFWTFTLSDSREEFTNFAALIGKWLDAAPSRVPLNDWYDTVTGRQEQFQARSVVGGVYIKALSDPALAKKWQGRTE